MVVVHLEVVHTRVNATDFDGCRGGLGTGRLAFNFGIFNVLVFEEVIDG